VDLAQVANIMGRGGWWLPAVLVPHIAFLAIETLGWRPLFAPLGLSPRYLPLLRVRFVVEAISRTLPAGAVWCDTIKPMLLKRRCQVPVPDGVAGMVARKYCVFLSHAACIALALIFCGDALTRASQGFGFGSGLLWGLGAAAAVLALCSQVMVMALRRGALAERAFGLLSRIPFLASRVGPFRGGFRQTDARVARALELRPRALVKINGWFLLSWLCEVFETYLMLVILGVDVSLSEAIVIEVVVSFGRHLFVFLPGGLGIQDVGYVAFLAAFGVEDALTLGAAFALLKRGKDLFWSALGLVLLSSDVKEPPREASPPVRALPVPAS
jgi:glycosyltransferase 2 family protein